MLSAVNPISHNDYAINFKRKLSPEKIKEYKSVKRLINENYGKSFKNYDKFFKKCRKNILIKK